MQIPIWSTFTEDIDVGNYVLGAGFPAGGQKTYFSGFVSSFDERDGIPVHTVIDTSISPGNSGSGVFILEDGKPHLAGIVQVYYTRKTGQAGMSPLSYLRNFIKDTPLEDEYL